MLKIDYSFHFQEIARLLRPNTLRAKYGIDRIRNAVHCTDLPGDGIIEVKYVIPILVVCVHRPLARHMKIKGQPV